MFHGLIAPATPGAILEIHLDIMEASPAFLARMTEMGFEPDPFLDFYPPQYNFHYTGRMRVIPSRLQAILPDVYELIDRIVQEALIADVKFYVECELVRKTHYFCDNKEQNVPLSLRPFSFAENPGKSVTADIHVEFQSGTVSESVRELLVNNCFYWVRTPASLRFPSEEIATLQACSFGAARSVYQYLVSNPLPACTGMHLEQKLAMVPSHPGLPMPPAISVLVTGNHHE